MPALNIYKSPITDLNEPFESDLGGNTMGRGVTLQREGGGFGERKAAIMWRVNASAVGERRRIRQREGWGKKRKRG